MNKVGYLFVLALLIAFGQSNADHIYHLTMSAGSVQKLANEVRSTPEFKLEGFKTDGFYRIKNKGKYLSQNLLNYMRYGNVDPKEEGTIVTAFYSDYMPPLATKGKPVNYIVNNDKLDSGVRKSIVDYVQRTQKQNA